MATATSISTGIEKGRRVAQLYRDWQAVNTVSTDEWVPRGLMTPEEFTDYRAFSALESKAYVAKRVAEDAMPGYVPNRSPKFQAAHERLDGLQTQRRERDEAIRGLQACQSSYRSSEGFASNFSDMKVALDTLLASIPLEETAAIASAQRSVAAFERTQGQQQTDAWDVYIKAQAKAGQRAYAEVIASDPELKRAAHIAGVAMSRRIKEKQASIIAEIRAVLRA